MTDSIQTLRSEARRLARGKVPRAVRYPASFRATAIALARAQRRQGHAVERVATAIGVATPTLVRWLSAHPAPRLRRVAVVGPPAESALASTVVLVTPQGVRVEGLDRESLVAVLRALA